MADAGLIYVYVMIIFFVMLVINYLVIRNKKNNPKEVRRLRSVTIWAGFCMLVNIAIAFNDRIQIAYPLYALYFAGIDVLLFALLCFVVTYTSMEESRAARTVVRLFGFLCTIDVISLVLNAWTRHSFGLIPMEDENTLYFVCDGYLPYRLHLYFDYVMIAVMFVMLIQKAFRVAHIYRLRYTSYVALLTIVVIVNIIYMSLEMKNDWSVCLYGLFIVALSGISNNYTIEKLKSAMLNQIIDHMEDGLLIFDEKGNNIYANRLAMQILGTDNMEMITDHDALEKYLLEGSVSDEGITIRRDEANGKYYRIFIQTIKEKNGLDIGSFYIMRDITISMNAIALEREKNETDALTGLNDREYFCELVTEELKKNLDTEYLMICTNYEHFKLMNRIFGRNKADEILRETAERIRMCSKDAIYGRIDGDCFAMLLRLDEYNERMFIDMTNRIDLMLERHNYTMRIMVGVYEVKDRTVPVTVMCDKALLAARQYKSGYSKRIQYYSDEMERQLADEQHYAAKLFDAIVNGEIRMMLQPIVDADAKVVGAEGLVRWVRSDGHIIMPEEFIDFFEKSGLIYKLDLYMWREAVKELRRWKDMGREELFLSVNITGNDMYLADIYNILLHLTEEYEINPSRLHIEIAELSMGGRENSQLQVLSLLRSKGFVVWMDNFGSAYSSINLLHDINVDAIKLDIASLYDPEDLFKTRKALEGVMGLANSLSLDIIPEKVGSGEMFDLVKDMGCRYYQGNYFDSAMKPEAFEQKYVQQ